MPSFTRKLRESHKVIFYNNKILSIRGNSENVYDCYVLWDFDLFGYVNVQKLYEKAVIRKFRCCSHKFLPVFSRNIIEEAISGEIGAIKRNMVSAIYQLRLSCTKIYHPDLMSGCIIDTIKNYVRICHQYLQKLIKLLSLCYMVDTCNDRNRHKTS